MVEFEDPRNLVGAVLDQRWKLVGLRGEGGVGVVYEAEGVAGEGTRAIKLLRHEFCEDSSIVARFLEEAEASARVKHENVVRVHEAARAEDGTPYLVMDLLRGQPLSTAMNRGRLAVEQAVAVADGVLQALEAAHQAGVVHRDLKPDNVFLLQDAADILRVKVLDFGVARVMDAAGGMARKTNTGMLLGTPGYMSPEQIRNVKHADARADLWGVGVIFYEMLTGMLAFEGDNDFTRITRVLSGEVTPIEQVAPQYAHWGPFFVRALAREPEQRFQTAAEMSQALRGVAQGGQLPVAPVAPLPPQPSSDPMRTAAGPFGGTGTAVSPGAGAAAAPASALRSEPLVQVLPSLPSGVAPRWVVLAVVVALLVGLAVGYVIGVGVA
jgi:serine/threonine protein kinase